MAGNLTDIINTMTNVVLLGAPVALVLLLFFWNMSQLVFQSSNPEKLKDARERIIWSIIGMFVLFSLAGILVVLQNTLFGESNQNNGTIHSPTGQSPFTSGQSSSGTTGNQGNQSGSSGTQNSGTQNSGTHFIGPPAP